MCGGLADLRGTHNTKPHVFQESKTLLPGVPVVQCNYCRAGVKLSANKDNKSCWSETTFLFVKYGSLCLSCRTLFFRSDLRHVGVTVVESYSFSHPIWRLFVLLSKMAIFARNGPKSVATWWGIRVPACDMHWIPELLQWCVKLLRNRRMHASWSDDPVLTNGIRSAIICPMALARFHRRRDIVS